MTYTLKPPVLTPNAEAILRERYLRRDEDNNVIETPQGLFERVAGAVAQGEPEDQRERRAAEFLRADDVAEVPAQLPHPGQRRPGRARLPQRLFCNLARGRSAIDHADRLRCRDDREVGRRYRLRAVQDQAQGRPHRHHPRPGVWPDRGDEDVLRSGRRAHPGQLQTRGAHGSAAHIAPRHS